jgi:ATP-dependent Clp protease ATP-binding subunit ClpC
VLDLALREAVALGHNYIGPEHILLGLARENDGVASRILLDQGVDSKRFRRKSSTNLERLHRRITRSK